MLNPYSKDVIRDVLELFAVSSQIPIAMYELDADRITEIIRSVERLSVPEKVAVLPDDKLTDFIIVDNTRLAVIQYDSAAISDYDSRRFREMRQRLLSIVNQITREQLRMGRDIQIQESAYHELQIRLQVVIAIAENSLYELSEQPSVLRDTIQDLMGAAESASTAMHNLTHGQYLPERYRFRRYPIGHFVDQAVKLCRAEARKKNIEIVVDLQPQSGHTGIEASDIHLQQAFNNLLQNAVKYSYRPSPGADHRYVSVRGGISNNGYELAISNYGVGVEPDDYSLIFTDGYKGRLTRQEYRSGAGQGLATVRRVIERHRGEVTVKSEPASVVPDEGARPYVTRFTVWLPFKQPDSEELL